MTPREGAAVIERGGELKAAMVAAAEIAVPLPVSGLFSYRIPEEMAANIQPGIRVKVPFKNRVLTGYVVGKKSVPENQKLKAVLEVMDEAPVLSPSLLELTRWISEYYVSSWGEAIENALPKWVKYGKKAERYLASSPPNPVTQAKPPLKLQLTDDQKKALEVIEKGLNSDSPKPILLYGVTGSGKSEIYIRAIQQVLSQAKTAICLVPEIALTEQIRRFFFHHFGGELEILHSKLGDGERFLAWKRLESGEKKVVLGPRSAVFAPLARLGLIIIDEEQEGSYKQETTPRYHAREVAIWRARHERALLITGSATPSLESMHRTDRDEFERVDLASRIDDKALPFVRILDLKENLISRKKSSILTPQLAAEIEKNLKRKEGTLLLLNRRGFSTRILCSQCGTIESCLSCQVSLTFHQEDQTLLCHYCNFQKALPTACMKCQSPVLQFLGFGTERAESELAARFPTAKIARMDADTVQKKGSHEKILREFREQRIDILLGTQMIAKGFDFPHVTLVGVLLADIGLALPDFRSAERTFQLLTQVAGRAGRGKLPGRVYIQTFSPDHPSIRFAKDHDYLNFYRQECAVRQEYHYPPVFRLINFIIRSGVEKKAYAHARSFRDFLRQNLQEPYEILGPAPLPFYRLRGHFRFHVMIKIPPGKQVPREVLEQASSLKKPSGVAFVIDVDPTNIL